MWVRIYSTYAKNCFNVGCIRQMPFAKQTLFEKILSIPLPFFFLLPFLYFGLINKLHFESQPYENLNTCIVLILFCNVHLWGARISLISCSCSVFFLSNQGWPLPEKEVFCLNLRKDEARNERASWNNTASSFPRTRRLLNSPALPLTAELPPTKQQLLPLPSNNQLMDDPKDR